MTEFQLGSLIAAGVFVGAVSVYNWWQEYRYKKQANKAFARNQDDVLINAPKNMVRKGDAQRLEPVFDAPKVDVTAGPATLEDAVSASTPEYDVPEFAPPAAPAVRYDEDMPDDIPDLPPSYRMAYASKPQESPQSTAYTPTAVREVEEAPRFVASEPKMSAATVDAAISKPVFEAEDDNLLVSSLIDPALDFIAEVHAGQAIAAAEVPPFPATKRIQVIGLNQLDQWEAVNSTSRNRYLELRVGMQMADRQGPITQESLNAFCMAVQQFADDHEALVTFPQRSSKLSAARELDDFCASVDVLIGLNIPAGVRPIPMEKVRLHAENAGMVRANDGTFQYRSDSGKTLFVLANQDQTPLMATSKGLTLLFDVPRVAGGIAVFDYLTEFAQSLSQALALDLVDDNGKALNAQSLANIRRQLADLYASMDDRGIAPGSVAALRLFA
ncbi:cell division protein FtsZ [Chitinibacter bivalviorum]|uniref:Cell division protein ZipA n=1 Tax=Chitinibacter bivalviorum TaxID=2739434 RepID=A0A7H9BF33_9NEIS|nr:cell division protein ZipA C-terminal FtsZ-binding domain-containing protein [Chitinibacter bivalviorum]QLG87313.1 cell division protein FtsZ [Chitinibacter bivalviorum]